jgi:hypothetical protein
MGTFKGNGFFMFKRHPRRLNSLTVAVAKALGLSAVISALAAKEYLGKRRRSFSTLSPPGGYLC